MKIKTPEISWHAKEAIYSVDIQPHRKGQPHRLATAGIDSNVRIWELRSEHKSGIVFLSNLSRHERAVNVVRFSICGLTLASGGDDGTVVLWKLSERTDAPNIFEDSSDMGLNVETWNAHKVLRGHIEDINDLSWSPDGNYLLSGSIDYTAILWDVSKAVKLTIMSEAKHFIHGVAYDPLGEYAATISGDRSLRIYNLKSTRVIHKVCKLSYPSSDDNGDSNKDDGDIPTTKSQRMFHDETVVRRRLSFTMDGNLLIVPSGSLNRKKGGEVEQINTAYVFSRSSFSKPVAILPGFKQPVTVIRTCPVKFALRKSDDGSAVNLPYRLIFAVSSSDTVILYDSQTLEPFSVVSNVHYAAITDITWSSDARQLVISSRDGFCTIVDFEEDELGETYCEILANSDTRQEPMDTENNNDAAVESDKTETGCGTGENIVCDVMNGKPKLVSTTEDCQTMDTSTEIKENGPLPSSQEKKVSRRVQLTTISHSPISTKPRRIPLTPVADSPQGDKHVHTNKTVVCNGNSPAASTTMTPKSAKDDTVVQKKTARRIQLTPVSK